MKQGARKKWPAGELFDAERLACVGPDSWARAPGDDDPDEGETITLGDFLSSMASEMKRRVS